MVQLPYQRELKYLSQSVVPAVWSTVAGPLLVVIAPRQTLEKRVASQPVVPSG